MIATKKTPLDSVLAFVPEIAGEIRALDGGTRSAIQEIRLRGGLPVVLETGGSRLALRYIAESEFLEQLLGRFCEHSVHSHQRQLAGGFVTLPGGHRVGVCATAILSADEQSVVSIRCPTSLNIRIAKAYTGCAEILFDRMPGDFPGLMIIGKPMSAKTTVLRDFIRCLSYSKKIALIDERGEIAAKSGGRVTFDLGQNTDVLDAYPKAAGFSCALRALSPDYIATDEVDARDAEYLGRTAGVGAGLIVTAHCQDITRALADPGLSHLIKEGRISHIAHLGTGRDIGRLIELRVLGDRK